MKKRIVPILLALLLTLSLMLGGCAAKSDKPVVSDEPPVTEPSDSSAPVTTDDAATSPPETTIDETPVPADTTTAPVTTAPTTTPAETTKPTKQTPTKPVVKVPVKTPVVTEPEATEPEPVEEPDEALPKATDSAMVTIAPDKVFDVKADKGLLTVRYLLLDADHKSGDSILIHTPEGKFMLIDAGVSEAGSQVVDYLKKLGITKIDALVNTHPHADHLGGMVEVINAFDIGAYYKNPRDYSSISSVYKKTMDALAAKNIPVTVLTEGDTLDLESDLQINVYNPPKDNDPLKYAKNDGLTSEDLTEQLNSESLALLFTYKDVKLMFDGDLYQRAEGDMLARNPEGTFDVDIVHAPHHGAATSSSNDYLLATDPSLVVMSTNGLQSLDIYKKYAYYGSVVVANSLNGNILITTEGTKESIHAYVEHQTRPEDGRPIVES